MKLVEKHIIKKENEYWKEIDYICFQSKNLYNCCNYYIRQKFFNDERVNESELYYYAKELPEYKFQPRKVSKNILKRVIWIWKSYYNAIKEYKINPEKFLAEPRIPGYKDKKNGRFITVYDIQSFSKKRLKDKIIKLSGTNVEISTYKNRIKEVRIIPTTSCYEVEIVYEQEEKNENLDKSLALGIDIGVNNLAALTSNKIGFQPILINGRPLKSINQYYNKKKAHFQSKLKEETYVSNRINRMSLKRKNKINDYFHKSSKYIIDLCIKNNIGRIVVGKNDNWKQEVNLGKRNNQNFCNIPHAKFIDMIKYKSEMIGITFEVIEESYTSKCSFYHREEMIHHDKYIGVRKPRGLYKTPELIINSDLNGSYNIIRKAVPNIFRDYGIEGLSVSPLVHTIKLN